MRLCIMGEQLELKIKFGDIGWKIAILSSSIVKNNKTIIELKDYPHDYVFLVEKSDNIRANEVILDGHLCTTVGLLEGEEYIFNFIDSKIETASEVDISIFRSIDLELLKSYLKGELINYPFKIFDVYYFKEIQTYAQIMNVRPKGSRFFKINEHTRINFNIIGNYKDRSNMFYLSIIETLTQENKVLKRNLTKSKSEVLELIKTIFELGIKVGSGEIDNTRVSEYIMRYPKTEYIDKYFLINLESEICKILSKTMEERK